MTLIDITAAIDMNEREARETVDDIKKGINTVRARIYELDRRKGWKALGYKSFRACCFKEFPLLHAKTVEEHLSAARVEAALQEFPGAHGKIGDMPGSHAKSLGSLKHDPVALHDAYERAKEIAEEENDGKLTGSIVSRAVKEAPATHEWTEDELNRKAIVESGGAVVANMRQDTDRALLEWARKTDCFVRIDRNTEWGNPFEMGKDGDRDTVCNSYEIFFPRKFSLHNRLDELKGKVLGCWCYPARCHGMYLAAKVEEVDGSL